MKDERAGYRVRTDDIQLGKPGVAPGVDDDTEPRGRMFLIDENDPYAVATLLVLDGTAIDEITNELRGYDQHFDRLARDEQANLSVCAMKDAADRTICKILGILSQARPQRKGATARDISSRAVASNGVSR
jgi:hypothetical protein